MDSWWSLKKGAFPGYLPADIHNFDIHDLAGTFLSIGGSFSTLLTCGELPVVLPEAKRIIKMDNLILISLFLSITP